VSQHLALLRSHRLVRERREGRHVFYRLSRPQLAAWILDGLDFLELEFDLGEKMRSAVEEVRSLWSGKEKQEARR
jgi:DNA-binding transcriptional ArsR family regulator